MEFCNLCENMLYVKIDVQDNKQQLQNYCKNCNFVKDLPNDKSIVIVKNNYEKKDKNYEMFINPYIKYDPTLPRVNNIKCINKDCKSKSKDVNNEVIYIKYDNDEMKYLYYCVHCENFWKL